MDAGCDTADAADAATDNDVGIDDDFGAGTDGFGVAFGTSDDSDTGVDSGTAAIAADNAVNAVNDGCFASDPKRTLMKMLLMIRR